MSSSPRELVVDIETSPVLGYSFQIGKNSFIQPDGVVEPTRILCWAAKWAGEKGVTFRSEYHDGREPMLQHLAVLLGEADVVLHYNGKSFDMPIIIRELSLLGIEPPPPLKQHDLYLQIRGAMKFDSHRLGFIVQQYDGMMAKLDAGGLGMWRRVLDGDEAAWRQFRTYNKRDVVITEALRDRVKPYLRGNINMNLYSDRPVCSSCRADALKARGVARTVTGTYQRYQCGDCGAWSQDTRRISGVTVKAAT